MLRTKQSLRWLSHYAVEIRDVKGLVYPPATIHICWVVCRTICLSLNPAAARFLDKNPLFKELHGTLDKLFRCLHEDRVGRQVKHAEVITKEEEVQLWESGELGTKDPKALKNAVFHYNKIPSCSELSVSILLTLSRLQWS